MSQLIHSSSLPQGFSKASLSVDASEENDGYSSAEDPMNSDPEDEGGKKLVSHCGPASRFLESHPCLFADIFSLATDGVCVCVQSPGRYVVVADHDKNGPQELTVKSGDSVQLVREGDDGRW